MSSGGPGRDEQGRPVREHSDRSDMGAETCRLTIGFLGGKTMKSSQVPTLSEILF